MLICARRKTGSTFCFSLSLFTSSKSCLVEDKPIIGTGVNSCFGQRLKGRKTPNKDGITRQKMSHQGLALIRLRNELG